MKKKVPKGMSDYQAEWIVDDEEDAEDADAENEVTIFNMF